MDALISAFVDEIKQVSFYQAEISIFTFSEKDFIDWFQRAAMYAEDGDGNIYNDNSSTEADGEIIAYWTIIRAPIYPPIPDCLVPLTTVSRRGIPESCLSNKLSRFVIHHLL